jgi:hypothetical protein
MVHLIITLIWILVLIALFAAAYYLIVWVFAQLGWPLPDMALKCLAVALVLVAIAWVIAALFGGSVALLPPALR